MRLTLPMALVLALIANLLPGGNRLPSDKKAGERSTDDRSAPAQPSSK